MRSRIRLIYVSVTILLSNDHKQAATKKSNVHPSGGSISALRFDKNEILDPSVWLMPTPHAACLSQWVPKQLYGVLLRPIARAQWNPTLDGRHLALFMHACNWKIHWGMPTRLDRSTYWRLIGLFIDFAYSLYNHVVFLLPAKPLLFHWWNSLLFQCHCSFLATALSLSMIILIFCFKLNYFQKYIAEWRL